MSQYDYDQAKHNAKAGKSAHDTQNDHWKVRQDRDAGHAAGKKKP